MTHLIRQPALLATLGALGALGLLSGAGAAYGVDPSHNSTPSPATVVACATPRASVRQCDTHAVADVDAARRGEGLAPMSLPGDFASLSVPEQLLALADIERVDRGLPPAAGLTRRLDLAAQAAAAAASDPIGPSGYSWGSNWAGGIRSTVLDDFSWMYDDGFGSQNIACGNPSASGCWGHRNNILASFEAPIGMGAGAHGSSLTELLVAAYRPLADGTESLLSPSWAQIAQTLPIGVAARTVHLGHGARTARLRIWASGEAMSVSASIAVGSGHGASPWSVAPAHCQLAAGTTCTLTITATVRHPRATLSLSGPNGRQTVQLS